MLSHDNMTWTWTSYNKLKGVDHECNPSEDTSGGSMLPSFLLPFVGDSDASEMH